jgi:hypothetical protein
MKTETIRNWLLWRWDGVATRFAKTIATILPERVRFYLAGAMDTSAFTIKRDGRTDGPHLVRDKCWDCGEMLHGSLYRLTTLEVVCVDCMWLRRGARRSDLQTGNVAKATG